jgi:UDPglucose 6-dehydrogenase
LAGVAFFDDPYAAVAGCDATVLATEWPDYGQLDWGRIHNLMKGNVVIDGRNLLNGSRLIEMGFQYEGIGLLPHSKEGTLSSRYE